MLSIERFKTLAIEAEARLSQLAIANAAVVFADGLAIAPGTGPFDRVIVQGVLADVPESLIGAIGDQGVLVAARPDPAGKRRQQIVRMTRKGGGGLEAVPVCPCRLQALLAGEAAAL